MLSSGTAGTVGIDPQVIRVDLDIQIFLDIRHNITGYKGCLPFSRGDVPAELVIRNARVANVFSLEYEQTDVAVARGIVVGMGTGYESAETIDAAGKVLIPGMIDGHIHIESTMLTPRRFAEAVAPRGTSAVMADPHEIANVLGTEGIRSMWQNAQGFAPGWELAWQPRLAENGFEI